ncbi:MAG: FtsX-like permease family protein, partial [Candidatus Thorarchaeota archaeon]
MFRYAFKRVLRGYKLFLALTLGVLIATTFFASMLMSADVTSQASVGQALEEVEYDARIAANNITWSNDQYDEIQNITESLPEVSSIERYAKISFNINNTPGQSFDLYGLQDTSTIWNSLTFLNATESLGANETFVVASSVNASLLSVGDLVTVPIRYMTNDSFFPSTFEVNLTVAGFVEISEGTARLLNPPRTINLGFIEIEIGDWRDYDLMLVNWENTMEPILSYYESQENETQLLATQGFLVHLNRDLLINPYDLGASSTNIQNALAKIEDRTAIYNTQTSNYVGTTLTFLSLAASLLVLSFVSLAAPVIFMSWYSSTMLSDVSYNLRRREFGLLQTKGFGPKAIKRMLTLEGVIIGIIGGTIGLFLGTYLAHFIVGVPIESPFITLAANPLNVIVTIAFGVVLAYWSIRGPADRAARLDTLDSLKQYIYVEEQREYKRLLPIIALVLGSYKLIVWILGIDMNTLLGGALSTNFILLIVVALWTPVDAFLNFAGPIAFLYGATKILLRGSQRFQEIVVGSGKRFFGAFGNLATRNIKRNPSRNAALVFVVALIVSYGIFSVGSLFSEQDLRARTDLYNVGSDVSAAFSAGDNMTDIIPSLESIDGVTSLTTEYQISLSTTRGQLPTRSIDTESWLESAFYEESWFSGDTFESMFSNFTGQKIILSITVAR